MFGLAEFDFVSKEDVETMSMMSYTPFRSKGERFSFIRLYLERMVGCAYVNIKLQKKKQDTICMDQ